MKTSDTKALRVSLIVGAFVFFASSIFAANPKQIKASEFVAQLDKEGKLAVIADMAEARLKTLIGDKANLSTLRARLRTVLRQKNWTQLDRFPVLPMSHMRGLRAAFGGLGGGGQGEGVVAEKFDGRLEDYLSGPCGKKASRPVPVHENFEGITEGHWPDTAMTECDVHQSIKVASLLNSLSRVNESRVRYGSMTVRNAHDFFEMLIYAGHQVEMRNERTYADFISYNDGDRAVIWPVWIDTGYKTQQGEPILVPVGHSHHSWRISGPLVNAKVMFFLGVSGVGFFAQVNSRPAWTGLRAYYSVSSENADGEAAIVKAVDFAGRYLRRIVYESSEYAQGMPANGYGFLGVCNDSNAVLEAATRIGEESQLPSVTTYPLMRDASLDIKPKLGDELDDLMARLPKDSAGLGSRADVLGRVLNMFPFESYDDPALHDETLRGQMKSISAELR